MLPPCSRAPCDQEPSTIMGVCSSTTQEELPQGSHNDADKILHELMALIPSRNQESRQQLYSDSQHLNRETLLREKFDATKRMDLTIFSRSDSLSTILFDTVLDVCEEPSRTAILRVFFKTMQQQMDARFHDILRQKEIEERFRKIFEEMELKVQALLENRKIEKEVCNDFRELKKTAEKISQELKNKTRESENMQTEIKKLNDKLDDMKERNRKMENSICQYEQERKETNNQASEARQTEAALKQKLGDMTKQRDELETKVELIAKQFDEVIKKKDGQFGEVVKKRNELEVKIELLEKHNAENSTGSGSYVDSSATPTILEKVCAEVERTLSAFVRTYMKCLDDEAAVSSWMSKVSNGVPYERAAHKKFGIQCLMQHALFNRFESEQFTKPSSVVLERKDFSRICFREFHEVSSQAVEALLADKESDFLVFVETLRCLINPELLGFQKSMDNRALYLQFVKLARDMYGLHKLMFSFDPPARILRANCGDQFVKTWMETVGQVEREDDPSSWVVGLMVMPGFQVRNNASIIRAKVYLMPRPTRH